MYHHTHTEAAEAKREGLMREREQRESRKSDKTDRAAEGGEGEGNERLYIPRMSLTQQTRALIRTS